MKRWIGVALLLVPMALSVTACSKAHKAGNDSMSVHGGRIVAAASLPVIGGVAGWRYKVAFGTDAAQC
ncbi:hypothetical protein BTH42_13985 [Burkholderia sp. SRS-W-2-2016]|uniref:hypothetical protein n=1 Tax=Burkholderia sp. SRS-W-2-2016 TaxID=1926878 RepID=UPI00094AFC4D|nr:hypothetical protein [Burkholderia sp. SRS-W-2-2016]OLL30889.1 hypothetical protein BTH42_13985 [Burkholderia sp. SRS-W-2-2016]